MMTTDVKNYLFRVWIKALWSSFRVWCAGILWM